MVDLELRVHGVNRLRVIDASMMPAVVAGGLNATTIMIGEKGADLVRASQRAFACMQRRKRTRRLPETVGEHMITAEFSLRPAACPAIFLK